MITVIGSLNMDLVIRAERAPGPGETLTGESFQLIPGGKGANQAVAAARDGAPCAMAGRLGDDAFGRALMESLGRDPIDRSYIQLLEGISTGVAGITVDAQGQNRILVVPGANGSFQARDMEEFRPLIARSHVLLLQLEIPLEAVERALTIAREEGVYSILNPAPATDLPSSFYRLADLMTPNESELALLSGLPVSDLDQVRQAGQILLDRGLQRLLVTLGSRGSLLMDREAWTSFPAYRVKALDTTAAGDCFNGVLASGIDRLIQREKSRRDFSPSLEDLSPVIDRASRASAISVTRPGAQPSLPRKEETDAFDLWYQDLAYDLP